MRNLSETPYLCICKVKNSLRTSSTSWSWKNRPASISGGWTCLILRWETSKKSHGAGGRVVRSAVGGTLPFEIVLNQCQKEGVGGTADSSPGPEALLVQVRRGACFTPAEKSVPLSEECGVRAGLWLLVVSRDRTAHAVWALLCRPSLLAGQACCPFQSHPVVGMGSVGARARPQDGRPSGWVEGACWCSLPFVLGKGGTAPRKCRDAIACLGYSIWFGSCVKTVLVRSQCCFSLSLP